MTVCAPYNPAERFADARESSLGAGLDSAVTTLWRANEPAMVVICNQEILESFPESNRDSSGLLDPPTERCIRNYGPALKRYAGQYGFDWRLVLAVMKQESGYSCNALSQKGAVGLMQLMPMAGEELARKLDLEDLSRAL